MMCWTIFAGTIIPKQHLKNSVVLQEPEILNDVEEIESFTDVMDLSDNLDNRLNGIVEIVLEKNPGLADYGPILPAGVAILLPDISESEDDTVPVIQLWA